MVAKTKTPKRGQEARRTDVPEDRKLLTPAQVAEQFGVDARTIRRWTSAGKLKAVKLGRLVRYRPEDIKRAAERGIR